MTDGLVIREAAAGEIDDVVALAGRALGWDPGDPNRALFEWKHLANPFGRSRLLVAVEQDGQLVGLRAFMRWRMIGRTVGGSAGENERRDAVRPVDTATAPEAQGRGVFTRLTRAAVEAEITAGTDFVFNTPNSQSRPGYLKMGWQEHGRVRTWVRPRSVGAVARILRARVPADKWSLTNDLGVPADAAFTDDRVAHLTPATDDHRFRTDISAPFLRWRYGLEQLAYRVVFTDDAAVVFRRRARGPAVEAVIDTVLALHPRAAADVLRRVRRDVDADYLLAAGDRLPGTVPVPGQGPVLTTRALTRPAPAPADLAFTLGDLELF